MKFFISELLQKEVDIGRNYLFLLRRKIAISYYRRRTDALLENTRREVSLKSKGHLSFSREQHLAYATVE